MVPTVTFHQLRDPGSHCCYPGSPDQARVAEVVANVAPVTLTGCPLPCLAGLGPEVWPQTAPAVGRVGDLLPGLPGGVNHPAAKGHGGSHRPL